MIEDALSEVSGRNCVVTGGTGLIGREVVRLLCDAGAHVRSVSLDQFAVDSRAEQVYGDLRDFSFCKQVTTDMDYVFHVAGIKGSVDVTKAQPASTFVPFLMMNTSVLEAARVNKARKTVYTSTIGTYASAEVFSESDYDICQPPMDNFPGWGKRMGELQAQAYLIEYGLENFSVVRPANVYGPGDNFDPATAMVIPALMARIQSGENPLVVWGDGSAIRDFAFSTDVAEGIILACLRGTKSRFVNLGSGQGVSVRELVETLQKVTPFEFQFDTTKPAGFPKRVMDISLARELIGWEPRTSLYDGLKQTWDWFIANKDEYLKRRNFFKQ